MSSAYGKVFRSIVFPSVQWLAGRDTMAVLREVEVTQWLPREEILNLQWARLKELLTHVYQTVPYYRQAFDAAGVLPAAIHTREDYTCVPLLSKDDIRSNPETFISTGHNSRLTVVRTGGSTGEPVRFWKDTRAIAAGIVDIRRTRAWWGIDLEDRVARFWGHSASFGPGMRGRVLKAVNPLKQILMNRREFSAYNMSAESMMRYWHEIERFRPQMIIGYASTLFVFARFLEEQQIDARKLGTKLIVSAAEVLHDSQRAAIENVFGCKVASEYGASEVGELAFECPHGTMHTLDEHVYLELVRTEAVQHLPPEYGEVVVTYLQNYGAPLIRYRLGDIARRSDRACDCGLGLGAIAEVQGRVHDLIQTPDGRYVHGELFTHIFDYLDGVQKFQIVQEALEHFTITIVKDMPLSPEQERFLRGRLAEHLGDQVHVDIRYADDIPLEKAGKFRWIKSLLR